jgi:hypothetical protein
MIALAVADVNSWTKPISGDWQEIDFWSLGELPEATQDIVFTNAGWKALAINAQTSQNFSNSMSVLSMSVNARPDSFNTLLMNFAGFQRPLQTGVLNIETNGSVQVQSSWLEIIRNSAGSSGSVGVGGTFKQGDFSIVTVQGGLSASTLNPGAYYFTNGLLRVAMDENIGRFGKPGKFVQFGGTNQTDHIYINTDGEYDLNGGQLTVTNGIRVGLGDFASSSSFYQIGGNLKNWREP